MTSAGTTGRTDCGTVALRIIRWNPRRASTSDKGGWRAGGRAEVREAGSGGGIPGS